MSQPASPWPVAALSMTGFTILALAVSIGGRVLSPSLVLDLVSLWPVLVLAIPGVVASILRPRTRLAGSSAVVLLTWLLVGLALHLASWDGLPSASADIRSSVGAESATAALAFVLEEGEAIVRAGDEFATTMQRIGGRTGPPDVEVAGADPVRFRVAASTATGWFRFGGVAVDLPTGPQWTVDISAPVVLLDLTGLQVGSLDVRAGSGSILLAEPTGQTPIRVSGPVTIVVPDGIAAEVTGPARVPNSWVADGDGFRTSGLESGWTIEVDPAGGSVSITNP